MVAKSYTKFTIFQSKFNILLFKITLQKYTHKHTWKYCSLQNVIYFGGWGLRKGNLLKLLENYYFSFLLGWLHVATDQQKSLTITTQWSDGWCVWELVPITQSSLWNLGYRDTGYESMTLSVQVHRLFAYLVSAFHSSPPPPPFKSLDSLLSAVWCKAAEGVGGGGSGV